MSGRPSPKSDNQATEDRRALWTWWFGYTALSAILVVPSLEGPLGWVALAALSAAYLALLLLFGAGSRLEMLIPAVILLVFTWIAGPKLNSVVRDSWQRAGAGKNPRGP